MVGNPYLIALRHPGRTQEIILQRHLLDARHSQKRRSIVVLTKDKLVEKLQTEVRILFHLVAKADPAKLDVKTTAVS